MEKQILSANYWVCEKPQARAVLQLLKSNNDNISRIDVLEVFKTKAYLENKNSPNSDASL